MPLIPLALQPGIYTEATDKDALNRWKDGLNVRWRNGKPQKLMGRQKASSDNFMGVCRGMKSWVALNGMKYLQIGTHRKLYIYSGGVFFDITPLRDSTSAPFSSAVLNGPFSSTVTSSNITVVHAAHGLEVGAYASFSGAAASPTDHILINGSYPVLSVPTVNSYTIDSGVVAAHSEVAFGGAAVDYDYQINPGFMDTTELFGYDSGSIDQGDYDNTGGSAAAVAIAQIWHVDTYGELGIANIHGAASYTWDTSAGTGGGNIAMAIANAPARINILLTDPIFERLIAFGCTKEGGDFDPMLIRASNRASMTLWAFSDTNTVFTFKASGGSEIVGVVHTFGAFFILTDTSANSFAPTFDDAEYQVTHLADGCGLIGPNALDQHNGKVFWMSQGNFFFYDGVVKIVLCDLWKTIFGDLNLAQKAKFRVVYEALNNEYRIYVATASSTEINKMYLWHPDDNWWGIGDFDDTAFISNSEGFPFPFSATADGYLWEHESGVDNGSSPLMSSLSSYSIALQNRSSIDYGIESGNQMMHVKRLIPDFKQLIGSIMIGLKSKKYGQSTEIISSPTQQLTAGTLYANIRARGRYVGVDLATANLGDFWDMGDLMIEAYPHGRR